MATDKEEIIDLNKEIELRIKWIDLNLAKLHLSSIESPFDEGQIELRECLIIVTQDLLEDLKNLIAKLESYGN